MFFIFFIFFILFWAEFKHTIIFRGSRKIIYYLCLNHSWAMFSVPLLSNKDLLLNIEYCDEKKELINLFNCDNMMFLDRKSNTFDKKYAENIMFNLKLRTIFIYYVKKYIEKNKNKKIKKIDFIEKKERIKLWNPNFDGSSVFVKISSYNF